MLALVSGFAVQAQLDTDADFKRQVYDTKVTFNVAGHSRGYSLGGRYLKFKDGFSLNGFEMDFAKLRHIKEVKTPSQQTPSSRGFVFNRINSFFTLRTGYIHEKILFDKTDKGTVSIALVTSGGVSWGLVKPVFVNISTDGSLGSIKSVRYDPGNPEGIILGESNFFKAIGQTQIQPGIYGKIGVNFDYQILEEKVTALEAGFIYDHFLKEVPIFYEEEGGEDLNWAGFFQMYISFNFGYRKN